MIKRFPTLVSMMFETLEASDMAVMGTGMETLGFIATTLKGKYMLQSQGFCSNIYLTESKYKLQQTNMSY